MTKTKRQVANKTPGGQQIKDKSPPLGLKSTGATLQRGLTTEDDPFTRAKEPSDMTDIRDQRPK